MAKQLNVNLAFGADTSKAKAAMEDLNKTLAKIQSTPGKGGLIDDVSIRRAAEAAKELQQHLNRAMNADTGKLDLNRFSQSLKSSGKDLKSYYNDLNKIGPAGDQAFLKLSRSIATAETSTIRINKRMQEFVTTLKNTARWQISSSVLHGLMGAVQSAYGYAQDLNASLNDIRIVTGASAEQMEKFAEKANRAAKALSTTTTEYTKASLIYFQQGLSDSEVEARTNVTIKMANAAGQSAEIISDQLTAVWNNFYDGTQSLEHFADAMVRLGADTASSSDEIAAGLEKFASIGPMIGLGFDEAAAALATVTAQTRQSADVVGTAYKTIFARMQGLNLGETLDDGTTLNKYSQALAKVGINIKDQNGAMKDMNDLLLEMGNKWQTISQDQQIALAQAVGGVRQYNQIVALMDNFDIYEQNLASAKNSEGSLDMQAAIYAESWEAAQDRVRAAAEGVYDSLLNEDFFVSFNDGLSVLLGGVEGLVDGFGGMKGVIATIGSLMLRHFAKEAPSALKNLKENVQGVLGLESKDSKKVVEDNNSILNGMDKTDPAKMSLNATIQSAQTLNKMTQQLNENQRQLSEEEKQAYQAKIDQVEATYDLIIAEGKELEQAEKKTAELEKQAIKKAAAVTMQKEAEKQARDEIEKNGGRREDETEKQYEKRIADRTSEIVAEKRQHTVGTQGSRRRSSAQSDEEKKIKKQTSALKEYIKKSEELERIQRNAKKQVASWKENADAIKGNEKEAAALSKNIRKALDNMQGIDKSTDDFKELENLLKSGSTDTDALIAAFEKVANSAETFKPIESALGKIDDKIAEVEKELGQLNMDSSDIDALEEEFRDGARAIQDFEQELEDLEDTADETPQHIVKTSEALASVGAAAGALVGMMSSIEGTMDVFSDEDATTIQKVGAAFGLLTTVVATATTVMEAAKKVEDAQILSKIKDTAVTGAHTVATSLSAIAQKGLAAAFQATIAPIKASGAALKDHPVMWIASIIMIAVGAIAAITSALDKAKEKRAEEAKVTKEAADAIYEEVQANNELVRSYEDALQAYKDGKGSKEDLAAATEALLNVYEVENADLLIAAGRYDELTAAIKRAEQAKLDQAKAKTQTAVADAEQVFEDQMRDGVGHFSGGDYIAKIGGGARSKDEKAVKNAVNDLIASGDINGDIISHDGNDINLNTGQSTEDLIQAYEEMQKLQNYLAQNVDAEVLDESENYQNLVEWLAKSSESYQNLIGLQEQLQDVSVQSAKNNVVKAHGEISSMEEYRQAEEDLTNALLADKSLNLDVDSARELAQQALAAEQSYAKMALDAQILDQATAATNGNISSEEMEEFFNSLSDDEKTLFATLNFDSAQSIEDLENQLAVLQERAENTTIRTNLEAVEGAQDKLKDDMSVDDYKDFETDSGITWGEDGIIKYSEFLKMTYDEQAEYLESLNEKYSDALGKSSEELIEANQNRINEIKKQLPELEKEVSQMENTLDKKGDGGLVVKAQKLDTSSTTYQTDLNNLADEYGVSAEDIQSYLDAYNNAVALNNEVNSLSSEISHLEDEAEINEILDFAQAKEDVQGLVKELAGLEEGGTIDAEQYKILSEYLPQLKDQFIETADGTYKLTAGLDGVQLSWRELSKLKGENGEKLLDSEDIANSITTINELREAWLASAISYEDYRARLAELVEQNLASAASLEELRAVAADAASRGALDYNAYAENLARLGEQYNNCTTEIEEYQQALLTGDSAQIQAAESALELAIEIGELASKFDLDAEETENYAKRLANSLKIDERAAAKLAVANQRVDRGLTNLNENLKDYSKSLKDNDKNSSKWSKTMDNLKKDLADVLNVADGSMLSDSFAEAALASDDLKKALDGDVEAIERLQTLAADDIMVNIVANQSTTETPEQIKSRWDQLKAAFEATDITAPNVNQAQLLASFNEMIAAGNMTKDQIEAALAGLHVSANVKTTYVPQKVTVPQTITEEAMVSNGFEEVMVPGSDGEWVPQKVQMKKKITRTYDAGTVEVDGVVPQYEIEGTEGAGGITTAFAPAPAVTPSFESTTSGGAGGGGGGGGGSSKPTSDARQKKTDVVDRYKEVNDQLDDMSDALNDASKAADRLYGSARLKQMEKVSQNLQKEINLLKQKKSEAEKNLIDDKTALDAAAKEVGISFEYAGNNIINYTEQMTDLYNRREALLDTFGEEIDEEEQKKLDALDKKIKEFEEALGLYEETKELIEDIENEIDDAFYEWQDNNYEMLSYKLELEIEINDAELQKLDYLLNKYSDNFYKMAESAVEMNNKIDPTKENLADYRNHQLELEEAYAAGEISQADYIEGLKEVRDGYYENLEALIELDKEMMHYLEDTLAAASEEVSEFTDHMEHLTGVFDHYINLMDILGKSKDYDAIGNFLGGKADTIRDRLTVAQEYYNMLKENSKADEYWANYQAALAADDVDMAQWWKEQWDAEVDALDEAQEEMLSLTEEWAEAMKAVVENNMAQLTDNLEKSLTNGLGFDKLMDDFDKLNTRQEEFLTKTNQIYETNKLMRTASKALDETDNSVAKQKLKNFIEETKSLQENTKLSKYELEIQQAKYDLLLAEIALEEAQNAKSTVRLSRDSEGNFGYVYTADQDAIADAEQGVDDAENNLYNISLEGQQNYTEKYLQAQQEMFNELDELWRLYYEEGAITQEEYNQRYADIQSHYYGPDGVLTTYANLYNIGVQTDADATADNWQKNYGAMTQNTEQWAADVNTYYQGVQGQIAIWEEVSVQANEDVEGALEDSETATKNLKDESSRLADTITDQVIPAIDEELEAVAAQTAAYAAQRESLLALIAEYENYIDAINASIAAQAGVSTNDHLGFDPDTDYSALMNEYLNKGGKVGDASYNELLKQRNAKIDWLETQGYDSSYWGTRGDETTAMYNELVAGGGDQAWFTKDYVDDSKLEGIFEQLGVPLGALEEAINGVKESTDAVGEKVDATGEKVDGVKDNNTTIGENIANKISETSETTDSKIDDTKDTLDSTITDTGDTAIDSIDTAKEETVSGLEAVQETISDDASAIIEAIGSAAGEVASAVGGAFSEIRGELSSLSSRVASLEAGSYDTGGYTGDWGPEGKLAILHEKEIVLNQNDTSNLLSAVGIIREISNMINAQASMASLFNLMAMPAVASNNETLEQSVTIHAEFPNATNHSEIEEAFNNLVNRASQYANRK